MRSSFRFAGVIAVIFAVCGAAGAQELAPPGSGVSISKIVIYSGSIHAVKYLVKGGSPRLQALVRRVEWTENELSVVEQLQMLKLDTVVNERYAAAFRSSQLTSPYFPPGFGPLSGAAGHGWDRSSPLQRSLSRQMAYEATSQAPVQLNGLLDHIPNQLNPMLREPPPQGKQAARGRWHPLRP